VSSGSDCLFFLVDLGQPSQQLIRVALGYFGVCKETIPGLGLPGNGEFFGKDGHDGPSYTQGKGR